MSGLLQVQVLRNMAIPTAVPYGFVSSSGGGGGPSLDTQSMVVGATGTSPYRTRGFVSGGVGSLTDGTSNIYSGAAITEFAYYENGGVVEGAPYYSLSITGAVNSGWTTVSVDGNLLQRADATFVSGNWQWPAATIALNYFGSTAGASRSIIFT